MKIYILFGFMFFSLLSCSESVLPEPSDEINPDNDSFVLSEEDILSGRLRIKLKEEPVEPVAVRSVDGKITTGMKILDGLASTMRITHMERTFPHAGKYEERTRREGLHLWYDVWFSEDIVASRAANDISFIEGIEIAVPIAKVSPTSSSNRHTPIQNEIKTRNSFLFNDPYLSRLWSYHNDGTETWQVANADIRLFDIWEEYNGHPDVIVSVVDGGIELSHPDLSNNLWVNLGEIPDNGVDDDNNGYIDDVYGYNFVSGTSAITPQRHGTHVAGTIAAVNNNGVGISGIAGGNGTPNSGVKLMSCQVFEHPPGDYYHDRVADNIGAAIKYGADNGAVISQNSWGYAVNEDARAAGSTRSSYIDPAHKEAIDYFVKYAGCDNDGNQLPTSPMKGGIVLFAVGNSNSEQERVAAPADYEKVIGVAAIGPDYKKPQYSNYGTYVDISAPGGLSNAEARIFSTTISALDYYEYRYGTSMSCPHVAAVAALVIQKNGVGEMGFTATMLEKILLTTAYNIDSYNPLYSGKLGYGCVDATAALRFTPSNSLPFQLSGNLITDGTLEFTVNTIDLAGKATVSLTNNIGGMVMKKTVNTSRFTPYTIDISKISAGSYTMRYECNGSVIEESIIKY